MTNCPKCGSECKKYEDTTDDFNVAFACEKCMIDFTPWQQKEIERLKGILQRVAELSEKEHKQSMIYASQRREQISHSDQMYLKGLSEAAAIAQEGL